MKNATLILAVSVAALFAGHAEAIYKCTTPKGVVYQDRPCKEGAESGVTIVIPTGQLAPKAGVAQDDAGQPGVVSPESRFDAPRQGRVTDESTSATKPADTRRAGATTSGAADQAKRNARVVESVLPMTADEARKTEPTAKYYTTDAAAGAETPTSMTCESPTGEKRRFILTNGTMTSI